MVSIRRLTVGRHYLQLSGLNALIRNPLTQYSNSPPFFVPKRDYSMQGVGRF